MESLYFCINSWWKTLKRSNRGLSASMGGKIVSLKNNQRKKPLNSHKVIVFLVLKCEIKCGSFLIFKNLAECPNVLYHHTWNGMFHLFVQNHFLVQHTILFSPTTPEHKNCQDAYLWTKQKEEKLWANQHLLLKPKELQVSYSSWQYHCWIHH